MAEQLRQPEWWDDECVEIRLFVHAFRAEQGIEVGSPISELFRESSIGQYLFGVWPRTPDFSGDWEYLRDPDYRKAALNRIRFQCRVVA